MEEFRNRLLVEEFAYRAVNSAYTTPIAHLAHWVIRACPVVYTRRVGEEFVEVCLVGAPKELKHQARAILARFDKRPERRHGRINGFVGARTSNRRIQCFIITTRE